MPTQRPTVTGNPFILTQAARLRDFPTLSEMIYLNSAAEGIPPLPVREALLRLKNIQLMSHAGRLRVAIHSDNTADDVEKFLRELRSALGSL